MCYLRLFQILSNEYINYIAELSFWHHMRSFILTELNVVTITIPTEPDEMGVDTGTREPNQYLPERDVTKIIVTDSEI